MLPLARRGDPDEGAGRGDQQPQLVRVGERIGVAEAVTTDLRCGGRGPGVTRKMVADAVEAVAGAVFLDGGFDAGRRLPSGDISGCTT